MSGTSSTALQAAAKAAERLLGFYPTITASDPKLYATALVQVFGSYPAHLVEMAVDPMNGLPGMHDFPPSVAAVKKFMDARLQAEKARQYEIDKQERAERLRLAEPPSDPKMKERIENGLLNLSAQIKAGIGPSTISDKFE